jgi:hypothetical protein
MISHEMATLSNVARIRAAAHQLTDEEVAYRALFRYIPGIRVGDKPTYEEVAYSFEAAMAEGRLATANALLYFV